MKAGARSIALSSMLLMQAFTCNGNDFGKKSLDERVASSDLVVIGTIGEAVKCGTRDVGECWAGSVTATVLVNDALKGEERTELLFRCSEPIVEKSPGACTLGARYILFLWKDSKGVFHTVDGPHGARLLPGVGE